MRAWLLLIVALIAPAQTYDFQGWGQNGVVTGATSGYKDSFLATNQAAFWPAGVGPDYAFTDPVGTRSFICVDSQTNHGYSSRTLVSAKGTYGYTVIGSTPTVCNLRTGEIVCSVSVAGISSPINNVNWSALDDRKMVYIGGNTVRTYDVASCPASWTTIATFDGTGGRPSLTINTGGTSDGSGEDHYAFYADTQKQVCVIDVQTAGYPHACASYSGLNISASVDNTIISKGVSSLTGRRYLLLQSGTYATAQWHYTTVAGGLTFSHQWESWESTGTGNKDGVWTASEAVTRGSHSDTGITSTGRQFYVRSCDVGSHRYWCMFWLDLETAATVPANVTISRRMTFPSAGSHRWPGATHMGCAKRSPVCITSCSGNWFKGGSLTTSSDWTLFRPLASAGEPYQTHVPLAYAVEAMYNAGERFRVVAHSRGQHWEGHEATGPWYDGFIRANISVDGNWVGYSTRFGSSDLTKMRTVFAHIGADAAKDLRVTQRAAPAAYLRFIAPTVAACTVTVSANASYSSPLMNAVSDGGGTAERVVDLSGLGLTAGTTYYVRVVCDGATADISFLMR